MSLGSSKVGSRISLPTLFVYIYYVYVSVHVYMYVYVYIYYVIMYMYMCIYIYVCIYRYIYMVCCDRSHRKHYTSRAAKSIATVCKGLCKCMSQRSALSKRYVYVYIHICIIGFWGLGFWGLGFPHPKP